MPERARFPAVCFASALGLMLALGSCTTVPAPQIAKIYEKAALDEIRNPVVVIHGILGARLADRETNPPKTIWGAFTSDAYDPNTPEGARALALPLTPLASAYDYINANERYHAAEPLNALKVGLFFNVVEIDVYKNIIRALGAGGYRDRVAYSPQDLRYQEDHFTCHTFFYDWRRDNVQNAIELGRKLKSLRRHIQTSATNKIHTLRQKGTPEALHEADRLEAWMKRGYKFDIVAHSMGGLIARYYLRYGAHDLPKDGSEPKVTWEGCKEIDKLVIVGTPNLGSIEALRNLTQGFQPAFFLPNFHQAILGTMPSIYQLLPRTRHGVVLGTDDEPTQLDLFDIDVWDRNDWGLLDPSSDRYLKWLEPDLKDRAGRRARAKTYLAWCLDRAKRFHQALDRKPETSCPENIYLFAGDAVPTLTRTVLRQHGQRLVPTFPGNEKTMSPGDATVPRYSSVGDERQGGPYQRGIRTCIPWRGVTFLADDHLGLTRSPTFTDNMLFILLEQLQEAGHHGLPQ